MTLSGLTTRGRGPAVRGRRSSGRPLAHGFSCETVDMDEDAWQRIVGAFDDANVYQTWPYGLVMGSRKRMGHVVVRRGDEVVAVAQTRLARVPLVGSGIAYVRWGPLWRRHGVTGDVEAFRQALRALRNECVQRRGLVLRVFPVSFVEDDGSVAAVLAEEGFAVATSSTQSRTILMDLRPGLGQLREGMRSNYKRTLRLAEQQGLEVIEGTDDHLFGAFVEMYREMVDRKRFVEPNDINVFRRMQRRLPERDKMRIMLGRADGRVCAGLVCSAMGDTAVYLFGATSPEGRKSGASYLLHWRLIERLKERGISMYDLNGINPATNPGTYKFKNDLAGVHGRTVTFLGQFVVDRGGLSRWCVAAGERLQGVRRRLRDYTRAVAKPAVSPP